MKGRANCKRPAELNLEIICEGREGNLIVEGKWRILTWAHASRCYMGKRGNPQPFLSELWLDFTSQSSPGEPRAFAVDTMTT